MSSLSPSLSACQASPDLSDSEVLSVMDSYCLREFGQNAETLNASLRDRVKAAQAARVARGSEGDIDPAAILFVDPIEVPKSRVPKVERRREATFQPRNIVEFKVMKQDVIITTGTKGCSLANHGGGGKRGVITGLSKGAKERMKLFFRNVPEGYNQFLTLTYHKNYPQDGRVAKEHLHRMVKWLKRNGVTAGAWFLEFQKRGAPHYHAIIKGSPSVTALRVAAAWARIIGEPLNSDCFRWHAGKLRNKPCLEWIRKPHAISSYVTKYATKSDQKEVPADYQNVGRFWGCWGDLKPVVTYFWGHGSHSVDSARSLLREWRIWWKTQNNVRLKNSDLKLRYAGTLWGGTEHLSGLIDSIGWTP